ncbi:MAG TPA: isocitrate/isopropylmalate dehydrogenase family protein [Polyangiaceae bacterium]|nr:isocitrate/isopropylmalate dehydrogenase family protein [Polyangiaceae bacterium]
MAKIAIIAGDGIGPEVTREATRLLEWYRDAAGLPLELWPLDLGADRYLRDGTTLPAALLERIRRECAAVFVGALGDPRVPGFEHARDILLGMRFGFDLYANVRPVRALADALVPLKGRRAEHVRFVVFRENTEGIYVGAGGQIRRGTADEIAISEDVNTRKGVERILRVAFEHARGTERRRLHMADKSNAMRHAHELWLRTFQELGPQYPEVEARHLYIDSLCLQLVQRPEDFDVIVTNNLFGDIVTDLAAALQGGLGMAPSANLHPAVPGHIALFEPVHGSAPELAGKDLANPMAALLTVGMLLSHLGWPDEERRIEAAVTRALVAGEATPDVGGALGTAAVGAAVRRRLAEPRGS